MIQAQSADGAVHEFPDGTDPAVIDRVMKAYATQSSPAVVGRSHNGGVTISAEPADAPRSLGDDVSGFMANVNRGTGIGDELAAAGNTAADIITGRAKFGADKPGNVVMNNLRMVGDTFQNELAGQRKDEDSFQAAHPHVAALGRGTGMAMTAAAPIGPGAEAFEGGNVMTNAARGATVAGLTGAGYAAVDRGTLQERAAAAGKAARDPVTLGLGAVGGAAATPLPSTARGSTAPSLEQLTAAKDAAYKAVDDSGVKFTPEAFQGLTQDMAGAADEAGFHAGVHPKTAAMLQRIGASDRGVGGYSPTLSELDQLRQQIGTDLGASNDAGERRMGTILRGKIDDFIANATPEQLMGGDPSAAASLITQARDLNTRVAKLRGLDNLDEAAADRAAATGSGGNINNTTRQNAIRFKNSTGNLTPDEQAATQRVIDGTPAGNALRLAGKLSPEGNGLMTAGHVAALLPSHGVSAGIAVAGAVSKRVSDAMTAGNVQALRDLIATGGSAAQEVVHQLDDPRYADLRRQLANDLAVQAGVQGAGRPSMTGTHR